MAFDAFAKVVSQADSRGAYLSDAQVDALIGLVKDGNKRIDVVNRITSNASVIVAS
ncbi:MAG TPA: phycocyanin subunit beta, partial [Trichocoleus sp.]